MSPHPFDQEYPCRIPRDTLHELATVIVTTVFGTETPNMIMETGVSRLSPADRWPERAALGATACLALEDPSLARIMAEYGYDSPECKAALAEKWCGLMIVGAYPTQVVDPANHVYFALLILEDAIHVELVQSKRNGQSGGWRLIHALICRLLPWARAYDIGRISAVAINERAARLFQREGFEEVKTDLFVESLKFKMALRLAVR